jgi:GNAT superfamily N-acetyltransferase
VIDPDVRPAAAADGDQLDLLERESRSALVGQRGGDRWLETNPARAGRWTDASAEGAVHVAHIDDVIVGYLVARHEVPIVRVVDVYVTGEARELGFGDALLAAAIEAGRSAGCDLVEGEALPGDRNTKNLYERAGITARLIVVSRRIV